MICLFATLIYNIHSKKSKVSTEQLILGDSWYNIRYRYNMVIKEAKRSRAVIFQGWQTTRDQHWMPPEKASFTVKAVNYTASTSRHGNTCCVTHCNTVQNEALGSQKSHGESAAQVESGFSKWHYDMSLHQILQLLERCHHAGHRSAWTEPRAPLMLCRMLACRAEQHTQPVTTEN